MMHPIDRRRFLSLLTRSAAAGLVSAASADGLFRRVEAQEMGGALPAGRRFVHLNFSNGGMGWMFTCLQPPSYKDARDKGGLAVWTPSLELDEVVTPGGGRFVIPRPILDSFEATGDRGALEMVLDGCVVLLGCGNGSPIHQVYSPSFQLSVSGRATDVSSEVARYQRFATRYPMVNLSGSPLFGTGPRSFLRVIDNDISKLFENVSTDSRFREEEVTRLSLLLDKLNGAEHAGPYARTLATQLVATREGGTLLKPPAGVLDKLVVTEQVMKSNGMPVAAAMQPLAVRLARADDVDVLTGGGVNTFFVGAIEVSALGRETLRISRGAAGIIQAMEGGIAAENVQMDGVQDDPHNKIAELHGVGDAAMLERAMLIKLSWVLRTLVELEKRDLFADTTVLVDGDFSRVLNAQYDDGGVNGVMLFSGGGRLRPGFYGDSGVESDGRCWFALPDLEGATPGSSMMPRLGMRQQGGGSVIPPRLALGITLYAMGMSPSEAGQAADLRADEISQIEVFARS